MSHPIHETSRTTLSDSIVRVEVREGLEYGTARKFREVVVNTHTNLTADEARQLVVDVQAAIAIVEALPVQRVEPRAAKCTGCGEPARGPHMRNCTLIALAAEPREFHPGDTIPADVHAVVAEAGYRWERDATATDWWLCEDADLEPLPVMTAKLLVSFGPVTEAGAR